MSKMIKQRTKSEVFREEMQKKVNENSRAVMSNLRLQGALCDVELRVGGVEFKAHKIILSSSSSFFWTLFNSAWSVLDKQTYTISGVSPEMMHLIIDYAYTHTLPLTEDNVVDVLGAADQLQVTGMTQACCFFLEDQLCLENCIGIWSLVDFYHCPDFSHKAFVFILHHFEETVSISEEFLQLSEQQLAALLQSDHLNVSRESLVFDIVLQWVSYRPGERQQHLPMLVAKLRLYLMTPSFLNKMKNNPLMKKHSTCLSVISDVLKSVTRGFYTKRPNSACSALMRRPRLPSVVLLVAGGNYNFAAATKLELYDIRSDRWVGLDAGFLPACHGAAVLDGFVYLVGGCSEGNCLNTVLRFDPTTSTWTYVAPMNAKRYSVSVAVLNGCIYAMGGFDALICHNTVECYDPETDTWTMIEPMILRRSGASATSLNGKVYICGGINGHVTNNLAEYYNPETRQWTLIASMRHSRSNFGIVAYKNKIFAVGGINSQHQYLNSVEAYDPSSNRWFCKPAMHIKRSSFGIEVVEDQIFVVGGSNRHSIFSFVECYDERERMWSWVSSIEKPRCNLSCCLLHGLYDLTQSLFPRGP